MALLANKLGTVFSTSIHGIRGRIIPAIRNQSTLKPILVSIEGNIGAGKSTLLDHLKRSRPEWKFIDEPVDTWATIQNDSDESMLEVFYRDRKRWSYTFQNCALLTRHQNIEGAVENARLLGKTGPLVFLTERCLDTDYNVFTKLLRDEGSIDKLELELYQRLLSQLKSTATPLAAIVHVNTKPQICLDRIAQRSRSGEEEIGLDYLKGLDEQQCGWVEKTHLPVHATTGNSMTDVKNVEDFIEGLVKKSL